MADTSLDTRATLRQDARIIGLIGLAHGTSHFFHLLLPPLFPWFIRDFGLSYTELGALVSVFFIVSGIGQAGAGFVVDRVGARPVLFAALGFFIAAALVASMVTGYGGLLLAAGLAGVGNAPFHPADFTILNKRVSGPRLGHAFSVHGISGNLGFALAPVVLAGIASVSGSWRLACLGAALLCALVLAVLFINRQAIDDRLGNWGHETGKVTAKSAAVEHPMAFLRLASVWLCFSFFFWSAASLSAVHSFASPALQELYGVPLAIAALVVTGYMLFGAAGMVVGGFLVGRFARLERTIAVSLMLGAALLVLAGSGWVSGVAAAVLAALAGFGAGLAGPSRDMLIRRAAPPGATGRVYGTVYSGLDIGFALGAPVFGLLLDSGQPGWVFHGAAVAFVVAVLSATLVGMRQRAPATASAATA